MIDTDKIIDTVNQSSKLANEIYKDALQGPSRQIGKTGENILKFVSLPFTFLGLTAEQLEDKYRVFIGQAMEKVPHEKRSMPQSAVVGPLLEHAKYLFGDNESPNLIEAFSNLLANAVNSDVKDEVHVSYVHTLLQLGHLEAEILRQLYELDDDYDLLGVVSKRDIDSDKKVIHVLSDEPEPLLLEEKNEFVYYYAIIWDDKIKISDSTLEASLDILIHHNLLQSFMIYNMKDEDEYSLKKPQSDDADDYDLYKSIHGYALTTYGRNFMSACTDPIYDIHSVFACKICNTVFHNNKANGICPECGCGDVELYR